MANYYVSNTGSDSNNGTSIDTPWRTISKVNSTSFTAGDSILFKRGDVWREQLIVPSSGNSTSSITFSFYGNSTFPPLICGADIIDVWEITQEGLYSADVAVSPTYLIFNGQIGKKVTTLGDVDSDFKWFWESGKIYIYSLSVGPIEKPARANCIYVLNKDYVTVNGIKAYGSTHAWNGVIQGIRSGAPIVGINIQDCDIGPGFIAGIYLYNPNNCVISGNRIYDFWNQKIYGSGGAGWCIRLYREAGVEGISGNSILGNDVSGSHVNVHLEGGVKDSSILYNCVRFAIVNNIDLTSNFVPSNPVTIKHNLVVHRPTWGAGHGIVVQYLESEGAIVENNIIISDYRNIVDQINVQLVCFQFNTSSNSIDKNIYHLSPDSTCKIGKLVSVEYSTFEEWVHALSTSNLVGKDVNTIYADPQFADQDNGDYHLSPTSPCIGAGTAISGITIDIEGNQLYPPYNIGPYGIADGALGMAPITSQGSLKSNLTEISGPGGKLDPAGTYRLADTKAARDATGFVYGVDHWGYTSTGIPKEILGSILIDNGIGPQFFCGTRYITGYSEPQTGATLEKIKRVAGVE